MQVRKIPNEQLNINYRFNEMKFRRVRGVIGI